MVRTYPRATEPHHASLAAALEPLLHAFFLRYFHGTVEIEHTDFAGVTDAQIQAAVDAAPEAAHTLDVKAQVDALSDVQKAAYLTLLDGINLERGRHGVGAITPAQFLAQVKAKVDNLP